MSDVKNKHLPLEDRPTCVYRAYTADGELLYVGIAQHLYNRLRGHRKNSAWYPGAHIAQVEWYEDRRQAYAVESWAINYEDPPWNVEAQWKFVPFILPIPVRSESVHLWHDDGGVFD